MARKKIRHGRDKGRARVRVGRKAPRAPRSAAHGRGEKGGSAAPPRGRPRSLPPHTPYARDSVSSLPSWGEREKERAKYLRELRELASYWYATLRVERSWRSATSSRTAARVSRA